MGKRQIDPIDVLEAAYSLDGTEDAWLGRVLERSAGALDGGLGVVAFTTRLEHLVEGRFDAVAATSGDPMPLLQAVNTGTPPEVIALLTRRAWIFGTMSEHLSQLGPQTYHEAFKDPAQPFGIIDAVGLFAHDGEGGVLDIAAPLSRPARTTPAQRAMWSKLAVHLTAMMRLRRRLAPGEEAVLTPDGSVAHAAADARGVRSRERLVAAVRDRERARGRLRREDPDRALAIWRGLIDGRWSLVDRFEHDGRRLVVAYPNAPDVIDPRRLTAAERRVVLYAARGASTKEIAYALGVSLSAVSDLLSRACRKLRIRRRVELAALMPAPGARAATIDHAGLSFDVIVEPRPDAGALASLTAAEREVAERVLRGQSDAQIAKARSTSARTVSNQLARIYRKLGVSGRSELAARVAASRSGSDGAPG